MDDEHSPALPLDLFSTSPTELVLFPSDIPKICINNAPYFGYQIEGKQWGVVQGCCNSWTCPRCGDIRARQEYGRIVQGIRQLSEYNVIYFITITCKGKEISKANAETGYFLWSTRFLDACYKRAKRSHFEWHYVQVTERQKRGHPHGHILTTFCPLDLYDGHVEKWKRNNDGKLRKLLCPALRSPWLAEQVKRSGLGEQYDVSFVDSVEGASRYVAKYLFKPTVFTDIWPPRWKRIRYSQDFPKLPERETVARVLLSREDWDYLAREALIVTTHTREDYNIASHFLLGHDCFVRLKERPPKERRKTA